MFVKNKNLFLTVAIVITFLLSAVIATPAYADEAIPPVDVPAETQVEETNPVAETGEEATPPSTGEVDSAPSEESVIEEEATLPTSGETDSAPSEEPTSDVEESILEQLPENTELIVLDEEGQVLPLVTQEAEQIIMEGDPMWCPVGVTPGGAGCTASTTSFVTMLTNLTALYGATGPSMAGVIWISENYNSNTHDNGVTTFNISGSTLTSMKDFALTIQGGWTEVGKGINTTNPSEFVGATLLIDDWNAPVTINDITISNSSNWGVYVETTGNVVLKNVQSNNNGNYGAYIVNDGGAGNVTITKSTFNGQTNTGGLYVASNGTITASDLTVNGNNGTGASLQNLNAVTPKAVTLTGTNTFSNNSSSGLAISSIGVVTINNLIANNNGYDGANINNNNTNATNVGVKLTGTSVFGDNTNSGLSIDSKGAVTLSNVYANSNNAYGVFISNTAASTVQGVTFSGTNEFKYNTIHGLSIVSKGTITLNNLNANSNGQMGISINNTGTAMSPISITGTNTFNLNGYSGLFISYSVSGGAVTLNNITANDNGQSGFTGYGASIGNSTGTTFKGVTLTGTNSFSNNYDSGLAISSSGAVTLNNVTANNNASSASGVFISNQASGDTKPMAVILNGTNTFNMNDQGGLYIATYGAVTLNNIKANDNGQGGITGNGVYIENVGSDKPQNVTIKGANEFNNNFINGLYVVSKGNITTNSLTANLNDNRGVELVNSSGVGNVTMTGTNFFSGNAEENLYIISLGTITLNNITANSSVNSTGAYISNTSAATSKNVTINGTNTFNSNDNEGLVILSKGIITVSNLNASINGAGNNGGGVLLYNINSPTKAGINVNGTNTFNSNTGKGLLIWTLGNVKTNSISASSNTGIGFDLYGTFDPNTGNVTMSGNNFFNANTGGSIQIDSYGTVTLNNITSTGSAGSGVNINNIYGGNTAPKPVTLTGTIVISNNTGGSGLLINSYGAITINNLTANNNNAFGAVLQNSGTSVPAAVTLNGTNKFDNNVSDNLNISSDGLIKINNITSTNSGNMGAALVNSSGTAAVTVSGTNYFDSNSNAGLYIQSSGIITLNNITSNNSTNDFGAQIWNTASGFATPKNIIMTGTNTFNNNSDTGLEIRTYGSVTINNLTANYNGLTGMNLNYGEGADIVNYFGDNTIVANITLTGNNTFNGNYTRGLSIISFGAVKLNNITASENDVYGVFLDNSNAPSNVYGVTLTGNNTFFDNGNDGLQIHTKGTVSLNNLNVTFNGSTGMYINNTYAGVATPKPVTITGINNFSNNVGGFFIQSYGAVTISKVTASNNTTGAGGYIENYLANTPANVTITGYGVFNTNNSGNGLVIISKGAVTLTNITTIGNTFSGLDVNNSFGTGNVTLTGTNTFNNNGNNGATINSSGNVSITKITADDNAQNGLVIVTNGIVTLTCGSLNLNTLYGWQVLNAPSVIMKGVFTAGNGSGDYTSSFIPTFTRTCPLP